MKTHTKEELAAFKLAIPEPFNKKPDWVVPIAPGHTMNVYSVFNHKGKNEFVMHIMCGDEIKQRVCVDNLVDVKGALLEASQAVMQYLDNTAPGGGPAAFRQH